MEEEEPDRPEGLFRGACGSIARGRAPKGEPQEETCDVFAFAGHKHTDLGATPFVHNVGELRLRTMKRKIDIEVCLTPLLQCAIARPGRGAVSEMGGTSPGEKYLSPHPGAELRTRFGVSSPTGNRSRESLRPTVAERSHHPWLGRTDR